MHDWTIFQIAEQVQMAALLNEIRALASAHERVSARMRCELAPFDPAIEIAERLTDHWGLLSTTLIARLGESNAPGSVSTDLPQNFAPADWQ